MEKTTAIDQKPTVRKPFFLLLMIVGGIALNLLGMELCSALRWPLYLDTLGTVLAAVMGGYLPGILVGYATQLISGFQNASGAYFGSINALVGVAAAYLAAKGFWRNPLRALLTVQVFALIAGLLGSLLTWCLSGFTVDTDTGLSMLLSGSGIGPFWSLLVSSLLYHLLDKAVIVLLAMLVLRFLPESWGALFRYEAWQQAPLTDEQREAALKGGFRSASLRTKLILLITAVMILVAVSSTAVCAVLYHRTTIEEHTRLGVGTARLVASTIDAERVDDYLAEGEAAEGYLETEERLYSIRDSSPDIEYVYVYRILPDGCHVVFDLDTEEVAGGEPGEIIGFDDSFSELIPSLLAGQTIEPLVTNDTFGWLLTVYQPVYNDEGVCQCYAAVDISMNLLTTNEMGFLARVISLFLGFFLLILFLGLWMAEYNIVLPINSMTIAADTFAYESEEARSESVQRFEALDIRTGDEIEGLYHAMDKTMGDTMQYVEDIHTQSETISKIQNGLILVLADMVESRDKCTGDHVRKTAEYARIIMEHMRKIGVYPEAMTDTFCQDVINSAPLHDVGKIHVSDTLLNKPGRLTDEEYDEMKSHTTAGSEILERAIETVGAGESGYLHEARNLAEYHHERWDGKGYPTGLSGEQIPLSARIMAVADVFDALVSRRSYKAPFTFERAMEIIQEGAGTQFDAEIVRAFVDASDEIRKVAEDLSGDN